VGGGVIYAVIVVLWAAVLVPMWLRRHDEVTESRSVDRFQGAMRTLSRREPGGDRREVLVPRRSATRALPDGAADQMSAAAQAAVRRRRTVLALAGVTVLLVVLGALKVIPLWAAPLPFVLLLGFLAQASMSTRRARARELAARRSRATAQRRARVAAAERAVATGRYPEPAESERPAERAAATERPFDQYVVETWVPVRSAAPTEAVRDPAFYDAVAENAWSPVEVPLPTYVLAPKAPRSVRVIDLTKPGSWTSGHLSDDELVEIDDQTGEPLSATPPPATSKPEGIVTGEVLIERLRAVGD
jgi:hypothetical protein